MRQALNVVVTSGPHTRVAFLVLYLADKYLEEQIKSFHPAPSK
jgi:hypothetical protein